MITIGTPERTEKKRRANVLVTSLVSKAHQLFTADIHIIVTIMKE